MKNALRLSIVALGACGNLNGVSGDGGEGVAAEVKKLYVKREHRRRGLAGQLCALLISQARSWDKRQIIAWSDSRFGEAHRFYESLGFVRLAGSRELFDLSQTVEYPFVLSL